MLRTRLYLGLLPLLLLFIVVGLASMFICRDLAQSIERKLLTSYRLMIGGYEMRDAAKLLTSDIHRALAGHALDVKGRYHDQRGRFQKTLMDQSFASAGTPRADVVARVGDAFDRLTVIGDDIVAQGGARSYDAYQQTEKALYQTLLALEEMTERDYHELQAEAGRVAANLRKTINLLAGAMVGGILLSLFLSYRLAQLLLQPIRTLTVSAAALGEGKLDQDVPVTSKDELGELARAFNTMAAKLRTFREATAAHSCDRR